MNKEIIYSRLSQSRLHVSIVIFKDYSFKVVIVDEIYTNENINYLKYIDFDKYAIDAKIINDTGDWLIVPEMINLESIENVISFDSIKNIIEGQNMITKINLIRNKKL